MADDKPTKLTPEELDALMPEGDMVHTFMNPTASMLIGADWKRSKILEAAKKRCELSGEQATAMKHGAVIWNEDNQPVFIETKGTDEPANC